MKSIWLFKVCLYLCFMDKRKTNGGHENGGRNELPKSEKKVPLTFYVKDKNKTKIKEKVEPTIKRLDK